MGSEMCIRDRLSLTLKWARDNRIPLPQALARVTTGPAAVLCGLSPSQSGRGDLAVGAPADLCLVDLEAEWLVAPPALQSHSRHTPFAGMMLPGRVRATLVGGSPDLIDPSRIYTPADIAALPLLRQSRESGLNMIYDGWLKPHTPANNLFTINSLIAMAGLTAAGFGVSCLPRDYFAEMVSGRQLVIARTSIAAPQSVYCAMFRRDADVAFCESVAELALSCCDFSASGGRH